MMYQLDFLYPIMLVFLVGIVLSFFCHKLKLPIPLVLLLAGIVIGKLAIPKEYITFPKAFVLGVAIFGLIMVTYDVFSRLKPHRHDTFSHIAAQTSFLQIGFMLLILGAVLIMTQITSDPISIALLCTLIAGISLPIAKLRSPRLKHLVETEVTFNEVFVVFVASVLMHFLVFRTRTSLYGSVPTYITMFGLEIIIGLGAGVLLGLVVFKIFRRLSRKMTPIGILAICLASYVLAELLDGAGVFAVLSLAVLFGAFTIKHKQELEEFSRTFSQSVEIMIFLLIGILVSIPLEKGFFLMSLLIFAMYLAIRYLVLLFVLRQHFFKPNERAVLSLIAPKGVVVAVLCLNAIFFEAELMPLLQILVAVILYSQITSLIAQKVER